MADFAALLAQLEAIEAACREQRWDEAATLLQAHDQQVRAVPLATWDASQLTQLLERQASLAQQMTQDRDAASAELGQLGASRRGAHAYTR